MTTLNRMLTNRANATKSTGPRTAAGLAKSSTNAIRHGLYRDTVIPTLGESAEEFTRLQAALHEQLKPRNILCARLIDRIAMLLWKLDRVMRYEATAMGAAVSAAVMPTGPDTIDGRGLDPALQVSETARPELRLAYLRRQLLWADDDSAELRLLLAVLSGEAPDDVAVPRSPVSLTADVHHHLRWPQGCGNGPWDMGCRTCGITGQSMTAGQLRGLLAKLAQDAGRNPNELIGTLREDMAGRVNSPNEWAPNARAEADRLAAGMRVAREQAAMAAAYANDAVTDRVVRSEAHLTRQLETTLELLEKTQVRKRKRGSNSKIDLVLKAMTECMGGVPGPVMMPDDLGSFRNHAVG